MNHTCQIYLKRIGSKKIKWKFITFFLISSLFFTVHAERNVELRYENWARDYGAGEFTEYLSVRGLEIERLLPEHQLLKTASMWKKCKASEFEIPPKDKWPFALKTLQLIQTLKTKDIVSSFQVVSAYRNTDLNRCAGGSIKSSHSATYAIDLIYPPGGVDISALCEFWKKSGAQWRMGLSKYPSGRIHIDTSGYRTWGEDHTRKTSYCK